MSKRSVVTGATLCCTQGLVSSPLVAQSEPSANTSGRTMATVDDFLPVVNILPFGLCTATGLPCVPITTSRWTCQSNICIGDRGILRDDGTLACMIGGTIFIVDPGQYRLLIRNLSGSISLEAMRLLASLLGKAELLGPNQGPLVSMFQGSTDTPPYDWPWCAAAVFWALKKSGWPHASAFQRKYPEEHAGEGWLAAARAEEFGMRITDTPRAGDVVVFDGGRHIGFVESVANGKVTTIEGNASKPGAPNPYDGDGVYRKTRTIGSNMTFIRVK